MCVVVLDLARAPPNQKMRNTVNTYSFAGVESNKTKVKIKDLITSHVYGTSSLQPRQMSKFSLATVRQPSNDLAKLNHIGLIKDFSDLAR